MSIEMKISEIMKIVKYVQKDTVVQVGGGRRFNAVSHDAVISSVRQACIDKNVLIYPEQLTGSFDIMVMSKDKEKLTGVYAASYNVHFVDAEDKSRLTIPIQAHAFGNDDKNPGKAVSYAVKTAILKMFMIETGENEEGRNFEKESITSERLGHIKKMMEKSNTDMAPFLNHLGVKVLEDLDNGDFNTVVALLQKKIDITAAKNGHN